MKNCVRCRYKKTRSYIFLLQLVIVKYVFLLCSYKFLIVQTRQRNTISYLHVWLSVLTMLSFSGSSFFSVTTSTTATNNNCSSSSLMLASIFLIHVRNECFKLESQSHSSDAFKTDNQQFRFWPKGGKKMCLHHQCLQD